MNNTYLDMYEPTSSRSPGAHRMQPQQIHRQGSRQFDGYGNLTPSYPQPGNYTPSESSQMSYMPESTRFDRMGATIANGLSNGMHNGGFAYDGAQSWNPNAFAPANGMPFAATTRAKSNNRGRSQLPQSWMASANQSPQFGQSGFHPVGSSNLANPPLSSDNLHHDGEDELIPTAIVIKNIPFAVKKEQLIDLMTRMQLPLPYAFNYHFDNGVFRGLAFANFTTHGETVEVIDRLNHCDVAGRKLRVEFKKMLPLHERERIEREKRQRRGQLEEQHRTPLEHHPSMSSMNSYMRHSPSPQPPKPTYDLNDAKTREFYNQIFLFKSDKTREFLDFPTDLNADERRIVHTIAHTLDLDHDSSGDQGSRKVRVSKPAYFENISPTNNVDYNGAMQNMRHNSHDAGHDNPLVSGFSQPPLMNPRPYDERLYNTTLRGQHSTSLLSVGVPDSPLGFGSRGDNLRAAKSHADLRTVPSPSPSPSLSQSGYGGQSRFEQFFSQNSASSQTSTMTNSAAPREDNAIVNGFGNMTIGATASAQSSPRNLRTMWSRDSDSFAAATTNNNNNAGAVGSNRSISTNFDDGNNANGRGPNHPARQPRGPAGTTAFSRPAPRQNGHQQRSSDELRTPSLLESTTA